MAILILSTQDNDHANAICDLLQEKGIETFRLNTDVLHLDKTIVSLTPFVDGNLSLSGHLLDCSNISAVFCHHPRITIPNSFGRDSLDRELFIAAWRNTITWLEDQLNHACWINRPTNSRKASSTVFQLNLARSVGFNIPHTCFTNSIKDIESFCAKYENIVIKSGSLRGVELSNYRMLSKVVNASQIDPEKLIHSPCIVQQYIPKLYELRIHVISNSVFSCRIDSQSSTKTMYDWRNYDLANTPHHIFNLDKKVKSQCIEMLNKLGLTFGIFDLVVTTEEDIVFLECNAQGYWLWIEKLTGLKITNAIANRLISC